MSRLSAQDMAMLRHADCVSIASDQFAWRELLEGFLVGRCDLQHSHEVRVASAGSFENQPH